MIVGMNRGLAAERCARELAATVGDHLVDVHIELGAAASHPHMQGKHVMVLASEDFVADFHNQSIGLSVEPLTSVVGNRCSLLESGVRSDHFMRNEITANAEMLQRALGLCAPQLVSGNINHAEAVCLCSNVGHVMSPASGTRPANLQIGEQHSACQTERAFVSPLSDAREPTIRSRSKRSLIRAD